MPRGAGVLIRTVNMMIVLTNLAYAALVLVAAATPVFWFLGLL